MSYANDYAAWSDDTYFAEERDPKKFGAAVFSAMDAWIQFIETAGLADRWTQNEFLYNGVDPKMTQDGCYTRESFRITGDNGELLNVLYNDYRNLLQHVLNLTTSQPPNMQARAINDDAESLVAAQTFDGVFEYYLNTYRSGRLLRQSRLAVEAALFQDMGSVLVEWDQFAGNIVGDNEQGQLVTEGDLYIKFRSVWDQFYDAGVEEEDEVDWVIVRDQINKHELARRFPEYSDEIKRTGKGGSKVYSWRRGFARPSKTDMIDVYKFYHRPTVALPKGRYALLLNPEIVLNMPRMEQPQGDLPTQWPEGNDTLQSQGDDSFVPNPYDCLPLFNVRAMEQQGGILGYCPGNVIAPVQMSQNVLASAMMTNLAMFGFRTLASKMATRSTLSRSLAG